MVDEHLSKTVSTSSKHISEPVPVPSNVSNAGKTSYEAVAGPSNMAHEEEVKIACS